MLGTGNTNLTLAGTLTGAGGITKVGTGILNISGGSYFDGTTLISGGVLEATSGFALSYSINGSGNSLVVNNASLVIAFSGRLNTASITGTGTTTINRLSTLGPTFIDQPFVINNGVLQTYGDNTLSSIGNISGAGALQVGGIASGGQGPGKVNELQLAPNGGRSVLNSLSIGAGCTLDITNDSIDIHYAGSTSPLQTIRAYLQADFNSSSNGIGLISSYTDSLHTIGYYDSGAGSDLIVGYCYFGDANLDGKVDGSDYSRIDSGYLNHATGWYNGDFNYDNVINGSDYTLIDNAFDTQGAQLSSQVVVATAQIASSGSAVPEPASVGLTGLGAIGLLTRRRRS